MLNAAAAVDAFQSGERCSRRRWLVTCNKQRNNGQRGVTRERDILSLASPRSASGRKTLSACARVISHRHCQFCHGCARPLSSPSRPTVLISEMAMASRPILCRSSRPIAPRHRTLFVTFSSLSSTGLRAWRAGHSVLRIHSYIHIIHDTHALRRGFCCCCWLLDRHTVTYRSRRVEVL